MWITLFFLTLVWFAETQAGVMYQGRGSSNQGKSRDTAVPLLPVVRDSYPTSSATLKPTVSHKNCRFVLEECLKGDVPWTRCYEDRIASCVLGRIFIPGFIHMRVNSSQEAEASPTYNHKVHIPSSALRKSRGAASEEEVLLVASVINSTYFKAAASREGHRCAYAPNRGRALPPPQLPAELLRLVNETEEGWVCRGLGLFLHWSMLATFSWMAVEGFHLYLLLVRVFNIYVRRYLLKLSLVGWGFPTLTVVVCGIVGVYGKYSLEVSDNNNQNSTAQICWMSSQFPQRLLVSYITTVALPCLVILYNSCMLGLVVFKLWELRRDRGGTESNSSWKKVNKEKGSRLWKDCATVLGLSCVLGLPWWLASTTYISLPGIYVFTIINSLQGVFLFLWSLALTCKSRPDSNSSVRDTSSTQKMMTTSFNN